MMDAIVYTHRTNGNGHLARPHTKSNGTVDHDWFLVLIGNQEHARHRSEYVFTPLETPVKDDPKYTDTRDFTAFLRWFNRNVAGYSLATVEDSEVVERMLSRYFRVYGVPARNWDSIRAQVADYRNEASA